MNKRFIRVIRHTEYNPTRPKIDNLLGLSPDDLLCGHITDEGRAKAEEAAKAWLGATFDDPTKVKILIRYSPTYWLDDPRLGQRAKESAAVFEKAAKELGCIVVGNQLDHRLCEALFFQTPFAAFLRELSGGKHGQDFWHAWEQDLHCEVRMSFGAEGPEEVGCRAMLALSNALDFLDAQPDDDYDHVVVMVTHGEVTVPLGMIHDVEVNGSHNKGITFKPSIDGELVVYETE